MMSDTSVGSTTKGIASSADYSCPDCGRTVARLHEGYCADCHNERQTRLDLHKAEYDRWMALSDGERADLIRRAIQ